MTASRFALPLFLALVACGQTHQREPPAQPVVQPPPARPTIAVEDRAAMERRWRVAVAALAAGRAPEVDVLDGCPASQLQFPDEPPRLVALAARWQEGGLLVSAPDADGNVRASVGPPMPAMTGVIFRRAPLGEWRLCAFEPGE